MEKPIIPIYTLRKIIDWQNVQLVNPDVWAFDINSSNSIVVELNFPSKVICFGLFLVQRGEVLINVDFQEIQLKKNDVVNLFPNNVIEFKKISNNARLKFILISIDYFSELNLELNSQEAFDILSNNYLKQVTLDDETMFSIIYHINHIQELNNPENANNFNLEMLKLHFSLIMYSLANYTQTQSEKGEYKTSRKEDIAVKFVGLVGQYFRYHKDVQYYADAIFVTRTHLTRTIKDVFNKNPKQIIEEKLIAEIKVFLMKKEFSIAEVMREFAFEDQAAFSKFFKKHTGVSPNFYRKTI
ncbi:helix-turn-helix domain-containing protein [Chryseobacterium sp.]|uniref:helix-turn-helix domain-containing protein n=1 Tax=Chryseobacterium sp. TaxID=1871047 RepID=UPI0028A1867D|nr:helix-turn-helix domain-containing protein [Chryseobacterium sp.]